MDKKLTNRRKHDKSKKALKSDDEDVEAREDEPVASHAEPISEDVGEHQENFEEEDNSAEESSGENDITSTDQEYAKLRQELSELSFEDLQKLKEKIGLKQFNEIYYGTPDSKKPQAIRDGKKKFKRENKNRPMEISSKRPVPRLKSSVPVKKQVVRDPRFDDLSGEYDDAIFRKTYGFLTGVKHREKEKLRKQLKKEKDPEKKRKINSLVIRLEQQEEIETQKQAKKEREMKLRADEKELVKEGKKPFYWKKSEQKKLELAEKFRELKKSGKVESYLGKKRKRTAARERKKLPNKGQQF